MSSRRISSYNSVKPIQAITVDAFSKFNSENVNRLSRIVSKSGNNDVVVNGLDVYGIDEPFSIKSSNLLNGCSWQTEDCSCSNDQFEFTRKTDVDKYYEYAETTIDSNLIPHDGRYSGYFELQFQLLNGTPSYLVFNLNDHVLDLKHLDMFNYKENNVDKTESGFHRLIFKYDFNFENVFVFRIGMYQNNKDSNAITNGSNIILKNVKLFQIFDNTKLDYYLSQESVIEYDKYGTSNVHPIHKIGVSKGVCIKDDVTIDLLKSNFNNNDKVVELDISNPSSWIHNNPYTISDFIKRFARPQVPAFGNCLNTDEKFYYDCIEQRLKYQITNGNEIYLTDDFKTGNNDYPVFIISSVRDGSTVKITFNKNQVKENTKWLVLYSNNKPIVSVHKPYYLKTNVIEFCDDSIEELDNISLKCLGDTLKVNGSLYCKETIHWAYVVIYSEYFKNPVINKNYVGLLRGEDLEKPEYREDYLVLAKLRIVDPYTADIITYSNSRQDLGVITAEDVNYFVTCKTGEIWNNDTPNTVTDAIDILRLKDIDNYLKEKYKHDYDAEISDAFNLIKSDNNQNDIKTKVTIDEYSHISRKTNDNGNKIKVTKIELDSGNKSYFDSISEGSVFELDSNFNHFIYTDSNNEKWAISKDLKEFGKFENIGDGKYAIHRKYIGFNKFGPFKFIDPSTTLPVIEFDWLFDDLKDLKIPSSVHSIVDNNSIISDKTDIKDDYVLSYHPDVNSSKNDTNNSQNHNQFISFRNNLLNSIILKNELDFLPNNPDTLLNKRVLYGVKDSDNKVRIYSSRHQLSDDMIDYHIINSVNNDSGLTVNPNNDGILDKSTKIIFDGDRPNSKFRTSTFLTSKTESSSKVIIDTNYYYANLINKRITISTDQDDNDVYHVESGSYDMNDLLYQYWFKPDAQIIDDKLHLRIDTEKNFIVRFSDIFEFLYKYCGSTGTRLSTFLNTDLSLNNKKAIDVVIDIDCTISRLRDLDRRLDGEYEVLDKYFKSKLLIINDCNETVKDEDYFNSYINTNFTLFYYPDSSGKYIPFRTAYDKLNNYVTSLKYDVNSTRGRVYINNDQFIWKDDRRGWNNDENDITSILKVFPSTSKARVNQTVADYVVDDNNAFDKARGCIKHTYAGCRSEFNFEYVKRYEPQDPDKLLSKYGIENSQDQSEDSNIEVEKEDEKFIHSLDKIFATAEYYTISNKKVTSYKGNNSNWIFTTDVGVISVLNQDEIVGDSLDELEEKIIESNINDSYTEEENIELEEFNQYSQGIAHIRIHRLQNVNNKNNGCLNLRLSDEENSENFRWLFSWEGTTGIWRSGDYRCADRLSLLSTSSKSNSTTFDVKQMVSWKNGVADEECVIVLSSQNKDLRSTVEVIPLTSILGKNSNGELYKYLSNRPDDSGTESICYTSKIGHSSQGTEFVDHMLVNNICVADSEEYGDMMFYIGKQRKDTYRFPPDTKDGKCSDTPHHASIVRTSWNPNVKKNSDTLQSAHKWITTGLDISTGYISNELTITPTKLIGSLKFDGQKPATSTINTIYTLHLGKSNNRFLSVGCANNFNTGIDWELSSYFAYGNSIPEKDYSSISNVKKYGDIVTSKLPSACGIPKSIYEYDGKIYIATTNGILIMDSYNVSPNSGKWIDFGDIIKHTKWRVPYNYRYKHNENSGANILTWMTSTPSVENSNEAKFDKFGISDYVKIKDGVTAVCGPFFAGYYKKDRMISIGNTFSDSFTEEIVSTPTIIDYDKYGNNIIVCGLYDLNKNEISMHKAIYNLTDKKLSYTKSSLAQIVTVDEGKYIALTGGGTVNLYSGSWNGNDFNFIKLASNDEKVECPVNVRRIAYHDNNIYCIKDKTVEVWKYYYDDNVSKWGFEKIETITHGYDINRYSKVFYDFDSLYFITLRHDPTNYFIKITRKINGNHKIDTLSTVSVGNPGIEEMKNGRKVYTIENSENFPCEKNYRLYFTYIYHSLESKAILSKFKSRSVVFGMLQGDRQPDYYDPFKTNINGRIKSGIYICGSNNYKIFPTGEREYTLAPSHYDSNLSQLYAYPAIGPVMGFPYYKLMYDRNIDSLLFAVNCNYYANARFTCCK